MPEGHVYILGSETGTLYTGVTSDFDKRLWEHRNGIKSTFATKYGCKRVLLHEQFTDIRSAISREKEIKGWTRAKKLALITKANPDFKDIAHLWGWRMIHRDESIHAIDGQLDPPQPTIPSPTKPPSSGAKGGAASSRLPQ